MRAVLDTNVLVSMALNPDGPFAPAWAAWRAGRFEVTVCDTLLNEVREVLARPKIAKRLNEADVSALTTLLNRHTLSFGLREPYPAFRDEDDRFLLALLETSRADVLVTGDGDLQALGEHARAMIVSPALFLEALT